MVNYLERKKGKTKVLTGFVITFLLGYVTASTSDLTRLTTWLAQWFPSHTAVPKHSLLQQSARVKKPEFEFYNLLTKEAMRSSEAVLVSQLVPISLPTTAPIPFSQKPQRLSQFSAEPAMKPMHEPQGKPPALAMNSAERYAIQVGAFRHQLEASHLQASLVIKGFSATVTPVTQNQITWFRVMVGPFYTKNQAESARLNLVRSERINGMIRRMDT